MKALTYTLLKMAKDKMAEEQKESMKSVLGKAIIEDSSVLIVLICSLIACLVAVTLGLSFLLLSLSSYFNPSPVALYSLTGTMLLICALAGIIYVSQRGIDRVEKYKRITQAKQNVSTSSAKEIFKPLLNELRSEQNKMRMAKYHHPHSVKVKTPEYPSVYYH